MTLTIYEGYDKSYVIVKPWRKSEPEWKVKTNDLYRELYKIADYVNNVLGEECIFELD